MRQFLAIEFPVKRITDIPVTVLNHIYWYRVHYGLSVKQSTGEHQDYWARLPKRLRKAQSRTADLERLITELERLAADAPTRVRKTREQKEGWRHKEVVLTAELAAALTALPDSLVARSFKSLFGAMDFPKALQPVELRIDKRDLDGHEVKRRDYNFVEPDVLLMGDSCLVMIEAKTKGHSKPSHVYSARQLLNYLRLVDECQHARKHRTSPEVPTRFVHLILVPASGVEWLRDAERWVVPTEDSATGRLVADGKALLQLGGTVPRSFERNLGRLLDEVAVYYRSWGSFHSALHSTIDALGTDPYQTHWTQICGDVENLAKRAASGVDSPPGSTGMEGRTL